jgi:cytochrome P450
MTTPATPPSAPSALHCCLGANLGKLEAQIAVAELARRYPRLRLVADQQFSFHPNISFRGPQAMWLTTGL